MERFQSELPQWSPDYLTKWIAWVRTAGNFPAWLLEFLEHLATDRRMRQFWSWLDGVDFSNHVWAKSAHTVGMVINRARRLPGFPGNLSPAKREAYLQKVRKHAGALIELLRNTKFDRDDIEDLSEQELDMPLGEVLWSWGDDESEDGHIVAFNVGANGRYRMPYDYPRSHLTETLTDLLEWTYWEDQWDGSFLTSSAPIVQENRETVTVIYFTCSVYEWFANHGVEVPFPILATVANVALELKASAQVDEDAVRKQVRRYQARKAKLLAAKEPAFVEEAGQNSSLSMDSVLSDPF